MGWKGLPGTNTLAYYENPEITAVKSSIEQAPGAFDLSKSVSCYLSKPK